MWFPLPWWEGIKGKGRQGTTPTSSVLWCSVPPSRGRRNRETFKRAKKISKDKDKQSKLEM